MIKYYVRTMEGRKDLLPDYFEKIIDKEHRYTKSYIDALYQINDYDAVLVVNYGYISVNPKWAIATARITATTGSAQATASGSSVNQCILTIHVTGSVLPQLFPARDSSSPTASSRISAAGLSTSLQRISSSRSTAYARAARSHSAEAPFSTTSSPHL